MRTALEEGIKSHRFAGIFPEQFLTAAGRHREAVVAADQRMVIRCLRNDLPGFVHDVSHVTPPIERALSRPSCCRQHVTGMLQTTFHCRPEGRIVTGLFPEKGLIVSSDCNLGETYFSILMAGCLSQIFGATDMAD